MKKLILILSVALTVLSFQACDKDKFLASKQEGNLNYDAYFSNDVQAEDAVNAVYNVLQWDHVHGQLDWVYGDVMSDDTYKGGEGDHDQPLMREMELYVHNAGNDYISSTWSQLYQGIFRANVVLSRIDEVPTDAWINGVGHRERIRAEAKFLRAYFYYRLNIMFGGVPLIIELLPSDKYVQPRASEAAIWAQIEKDLIEAIPSLPLKYEDNTTLAYEVANDLGRAHKGVAQTLLGKVYLYQKRWAEAKAMAEAVMASNQFKLFAAGSAEPNKFDNMFDVKHEDDAYLTAGQSEIIFEIHCGADYKYDYVYGWGNGDLGTLMNVYWLSRNHGGWGFNIPTDDLANEYEAGDLRKNATIAINLLPLLSVTYPELNSYLIDFNGQKRAPRKYIVPRSLIGSALSQGPSNFKIFRYADIYLMYAEAAANLGDSTAAIEKLMELRNKRGLTAMSPAVITGKKFDDGTFKDVVIGASLLDKIYHEYRVEFALEGRRFFDLVRWGLAEKELGPLGYKSYNAKFPIPQGEIDLAGLQQNPGY